MTETTFNKMETQLQTKRPQIEARLAETFVRHAIDNRGALASTRQSKTVATELFELFRQFATGEVEDTHVAAVAMQLAERGLAFVTAAQMMRELGSVLQENRAETAVALPTARFQFLFLEKFAAARELLQQRQQENAQMALQRALQTQLQQQRRSHRRQTRQNHDLNQILQLNAKLAKLDDEEILLAEAVSGICQALHLRDVTLYERQPEQNRWQLRTTSADTPPAALQTPTILEQLDAALESGEDVIQFSHADDEPPSMKVTILLQVGQRSIGALVVNSDHVPQKNREAFLIFVRTFAQNLAALWHNLYLFNQIKQRAKELEILHGRFVDRIWSDDNATLQASFTDGSLHFDQSAPSDPSSHAIPLAMGDQTFGQVLLPQHGGLTAEDKAFIQDLIQEMGDALNNAHLLQTTRAYSTQLSLAADVSRAATTILNQDQLIQEVVELIRDRFDFYYVGLFLVDEQRQTAVLKAGTGEAGRRQLARNHHHVIGSSSMIGTAIAAGEARVEQDVSQAHAFARNPLLPDTRSELALPLRARDRTIGALTVQSEHTHAFTDTAVTVLQSLADQLAIAISNASLFARLEGNLDETNRLYETSRRISTADNEHEIYQILVQFTGESGLADIANIIIEDDDDPNYLRVPALWSHHDLSHLPDHRFPRDRYASSEQLYRKEPLIVHADDSAEALDRYTKKIFQQYAVQQAIVIPLYQTNEWLGSLALLYTEMDPPETQQLQRLMTLTDQAAGILANRQLLRQTESLYRIGRALNQAITRDDALDIAVREVARYTGATRCRFVTYDKRKKRGQIAASSEPLEQSADLLLPTTDDYVYDYLQQERMPLLLTADDSVAPPEAIKRHVLRFGAQASLLVPSASQQELIGFMAIDSARGERPFKPSNVIFAQTIVDHLTTQTENIKLLDEALSRAQELITLNQIQSNISGVLALNKLTQTVYEQVGRLLDHTIFILALYDAETAVFQPLHVVHREETVNIEPFTLDTEHPLHQFLQSDQHKVTDAHSSLISIEKHLSTDEQPQSGLWIPLRRENKTVGLLSVQSFDPYAYSDIDIQLLRSIATQTGLAIANAQFFEEIQASNEKLRQLDRLKTQFLANMSHELRTPLNSIIGFSRIILKGIDGPLTKEQEEDLTSIHTNGHHLLTLINEILDMAKIEAGKMSLSFEPVDLVDAAQVTSTTVQSLMDKEKVRFIWDVPTTLPPIEADPIRIRQILINLLSNAAKYTREGSIQLKIRAQTEGVHISVADTGIGIDPEDKETIFAAFEQVDNSTTRSAGGTGLGLPITKWLVNMHQGRIWFDSEPNKGTTFHVTLPFKQENVQETADLSTNGTPSNKTE